MQEKPRGYFKVSENWQSSDSGEDYFPGWMNKVGWPLIKTALLCVIFLSCVWFDFSLKLSTLLCILITSLYKDVLALLTGKIRMSSMDNATFLSQPPNNIMSSNETHISCVDTQDIWRKALKFHPKMAYKVVRFCGDLYYEKMSDEEALSKMFYKLPAGKELSNQRDIDCFIRDNLSERLPMDGPLIRHYMQEYDPDDQQHLPPEKRNKGVCITKYHHGMCDGVSFMCMVLGLGKEYSRDYFIKSSDAKWY